MRVSRTIQLRVEPCLDHCTQVSDLTGGQRVEAEVLAALVAELRRRRAAQPADSPASSHPATEASANQADRPSSAQPPVPLVPPADHAASEPLTNGQASNTAAHGNGVSTQQNGDGEPCAALLIQCIQTRAMLCLVSLQRLALAVSLTWRACGLGVGSSQVWHWQCMTAVMGVQHLRPPDHGTRSG